ncbi:MAG TPA: hypothetical protein VGB82_23915 [Alphaproteobacteria bacterium]
MSDSAQTRLAKAEAVLGGGLMTTPGWVVVFQDISLIASTLAAVCGAIVGLHAVWRLWKRRKVSP